MSNCRFRSSLRCLFLLAIASMLFGGCNSQKQEEPAEQIVEEPKLDPIKVLIVGDEGLAERIERQWRAEKESKISTHSISENEFAESGFKIKPDVDAIIYPAGMIGELVTRETISEIPPTIWSDRELNKAEILRHPRTTTINYARKNYAVPLGAPQLTVIYRSDVLKAVGYEEFPSSIKSFDKLIRDLQAASSAGLGNDAGPLPTAVEYPLKKTDSNHWAAITFLSRVAPYIRHRGKLTTVFDKKDMTPLITSEPFVMALNELSQVITAKQAGELALKSPHEIYANILAGQTALGITWPTDAVEPPMAQVGVDDQDPHTFTDAIKVAAMPGSEDWYDISTSSWKKRSNADSNRVDLMVFDGLIASVPNSSPHTTTAYKFIIWLPGKQVSLNTMTRSLRSGPFRASHLGNPIRWTGEGVSEQAAQDYGDIIRAINEEQIVFVFPRIPGRNTYLAALGTQVIECLRGNRSAEDALKAVAEEWNSITQELGQQEQLAALRMSEGR